MNTTFLGGELDNKKIKCILAVFHIILHSYN